MHGVDTKIEPVDLARFALKRLGLIGKRGRRPTTVELEGLLDFGFRKSGILLLPFEVMYRFSLGHLVLRGQIRQEQARPAALRSKRYRFERTIERQTEPAATPAQGQRRWRHLRPEGTGTQAAGKAAFARPQSQTGLDLGAQTAGHGFTTAAGTQPRRLRRSNKRCSTQNTNSSRPTAIRVHHELSVPSNTIMVWIRPRISTPIRVPIT